MIRQSAEKESVDEARLPTLAELGEDLLQTTRERQILALTRPFIGVATFAAAVYAGAWWLTPIIVFLIFIAVVTVTHDVVHNSIGLSRLQTDLALFILGAILFESGHAYRATHSQHHQVFPGPNDPEGDPARMKLWQAALHGPFFLPKLWLWAYRRRAERTWLLAEAAWFATALIAAAMLWPVVPGFTAYVILTVVGSWVYPLLTVHLPHRHYGDSRLDQTHTLRGYVIPKLFLELTYHLEHHLYPRVPSHNLPELSDRLDPFFREAGVKPVRVP